VGQLRIGLIQLGGIEAGGPSAANLAEVESVLTVALEASGREGKPHDPGHVGGRPQTPGDSELEGALVDLPERMAALEARLGPAANPVVIDVGFDVASGRVLEEGTGPIDEVFMRVRDPASHRAVVAVGASIPHVEREEQGGRRLDDGTWRSWIEQGLVFAGEPE
jgi:hypothetical protein